MSWPLPLYELAQPLYELTSLHELAPATKWVDTLPVSQGIEPGYIVFPSHKNNVYNLVKVYCYLCGKENF